MICHCGLRHVVSCLYHASSTIDFHSVSEGHCVGGKLWPGRSKDHTSPEEDEKGSFILIRKLVYMDYQLVVSEDSSFIENSTIFIWMYNTYTNAKDHDHCVMLQKLFLSSGMAIFNCHFLLVILLIYKLY